MLPRDAAAASLRAGAAYDLCTYPNKSSRVWFGLGDCALRCGLAVCTFYWYALTHPVSFYIFCWQYNRVWYNKQPALAFILSLLHPVMPVLLAAVELISALRRSFSPPPEDTASKLWFSAPPGFVAPLLWGCCMNVSRMVALFMLCGRDPTALEHIIEERITTKDFGEIPCPAPHDQVWRDLMTQGGCRVPHQLGRWSGDKLHLDRDLGCSDVVIKLADAFFGIGDQFLVHGKDFHTAADLEHILQTSTFVDYEGATAGYKGRNVLLLEFCRPPPQIGVHSMDILTVATHDGVKVLNCLFWGECTGPSSHTTTAGYCVDIDEEKIVAPCRWYAPYFATASQKLVGMKLPGIKRACAQAVAAHSLSPHKWMKTIGWDVMVLQSGEVVFFEGNFGTIRIPRRIFLAPEVTAEFLKMYSWPFAQRPQIAASRSCPPSPPGREGMLISPAESETCGLSSVESQQTLASVPSAEMLRYRGSPPPSDTDRHAAPHGAAPHLLKH